MTHYIGVSNILLDGYLIGPTLKNSPVSISVDVIKEQILTDYKKTVWKELHEETDVVGEFTIPYTENNLVKFPNEMVIEGELQFLTTNGSLRVTISNASITVSHKLNYKGSGEHLIKFEFLALDVDGGKKIEILPIVPATSVSITNKTELAEPQYPGTSGISGEVVAIPENASQNFLWSTDDPDIVSVNIITGNLTFVSTGYTTLHARHIYGSLSDSVQVQCKASVGTVHISNKSTIETPQVLGTTGITATSYILPEDADQSVTWLSSAPEIVSINESTGAMSWLTLGSATITCTSTDDPSKTDTADVSCIRPDATGVSITNKTDLEVVRAPGTPDIVATSQVSPTDALQTVTWSSDAPTIIAVDASTGAISYIANGTANITVTSTNGSFEDTVAMRCQPNPTSVAITNKAEIEPVQIPGYTGVTAVSTVQPPEASQTVTWSSSDPDTIRIDASTGAITWITAGTVTLTATGGGGVTDTVVATCRPDAYSVEISNKAELEVEQPPQTPDVVAKATVLPSGSLQDVTWSTSNASAVDVHPSTGVITYVADGTATITVTSTDGGYTDTVVMTCTFSPATSVTITNKTEIEAVQVPGFTGISGEFSVVPTDALQGVLWSSSTPALVDVHPDTGAISWLSAGTATLIATAKDGTGLSDSVVATCRPLATSVSIDNKAELELARVVGSTGIVVASTVHPAGSLQGVSYASSNSAVISVDASTGAITYVASGQSTITVTSTDGGLTDTVLMTCLPPHATSVAITNKAEIETVRTPGASGVLVVTQVQPPEANQNVTYSSDSGSVTVSETGALTWVSDGTATITVTSVDGGLQDTVVATCQTPEEPFTYEFPDEYLGQDANTTQLGTPITITGCTELNMVSSPIYIFKTGESNGGTINFQCVLEYRVNDGAWTEYDALRDNPPSTNRTHYWVAKAIWSGAPSTVEVRINHSTGRRDGGGGGYARCNPQHQALGGDHSRVTGQRRP